MARRNKWKEVRYGSQVVTSGVCLAQGMVFRVRNPHLKDNGQAKVQFEVIGVHRGDWWEVGVGPEVGLFHEWLGG